MHIQPHLFFHARCGDAIAFYREALGAEQVMLIGYIDGPQPATAPDGNSLPLDKLMHATLQIGHAQMMLPDALARGQPELKGMSLSVSVADDAQARRYFDALAVDVQVQMPLNAAFLPRASAWSPAVSGWNGWRPPSRRLPAESLAVSRCVHSPAHRGNTRCVS